MPDNTVSVCRPGKWGNPFSVGKPSSDVPQKYRGIVPKDALHAVSLYSALVEEYGLPMSCDITEIRGRNLACFCKTGTPCHADVLLLLANAKLSLA
jgi:hypothetical protein